MKRAATKTKRPSIFPKVFTIVVIASYVVSALTTVWLFGFVYDSQVRISQFTVMAILSLVMPLVFAYVAYLRLLSPQRLYLSLQLSLTATAVSAAAKTLLIYIPPGVTSFENELLFYFQYEILPIAIGAIIFGMLLWRHSKALERGLSQKALAVSIVSLFVASAAQSFYFLIQQLPENTNISGFMNDAISTMIVPLVIFAIAYEVNRTKDMWLRVVNSTLVTTAIILLILAITSLVWLVSSFVTLEGATQVMFLDQQYLVVGLAIGMILVLLGYRQRTK